MNAGILFRIKTHNDLLGGGEGKETVKDTVQQGSGLQTEANKTETRPFCMKQVRNRNIPSDLVMPMNHKTHS